MAKCFWVRPENIVIVKQKFYRIKRNFPDVRIDSSTVRTGGKPFRTKTGGTTYPLGRTQGMIVCFTGKGQKKASEEMSEWFEYKM